MIVIVILLYLRVFVKHFGVCAHKGVATDISVVGCDFGSLCCGYLTTINDCFNEVRPKQWGVTSCSSTDNRQFSHKKIGTARWVRGVFYMPGMEKWVENECGACHCAVMIFLFARYDTWGKGMWWD